MSDEYYYLCVFFRCNFFRNHLGISLSHFRSLIFIPGDGRHPVGGFSLHPHKSINERKPPPPLAAAVAAAGIAAAAAAAAAVAAVT